MSNLEKTKLPTIAELFSDDLQTAYKSEQLNLLLNQQPKPEWVKDHPYIKGYKYLPIDKIEFMLRRIFKQYRIEITGQGVAFNGVWVTVRVHYLNPVSGQFDYHDGIGAMQLQTKQGTSPADLININNGAISMAFPIAKTIAIKDACDHFGNLFGANLNRKDTIEFTPDGNLAGAQISHDEMRELWELKKDGVKASDYANIQRIVDGQERHNYIKAKTYLMSV
jgi:hypothetical protein